MSFATYVASKKTFILTIHQTMADLIMRLLIDGSDEDWRYGEIKYKMNNAAITEVLIDGDGSSKLGRENDCSHLRRLNQVPSNTPSPCKADKTPSKADLRDKFAKLDTSGDNRLDFNEMCNLLRRGNPSLSDKELWVLYQACDKNQDGTVDFSEFIEFIYSETPSKRRLFHEL